MVKIYRVFQGKIHSLEVRETPYKYIVDNRKNSSEAFEYGSHFYKDHWDRTQGNAIKRALSQTRTKRMKIEAELIRANTELKAIEHLEKKFKAFTAKKKAAKKGGK
jgi:hypothetical protein